MPTTQAGSLFVYEPRDGGTIRYGEATHPGPPLGNVLTVGVNNPGGLRQKEQSLLELGPGIWSLAETQLSATTFKTSSQILRKEARLQNREVRLHGGSPAPLRVGSSWAGSWTGFAVLADVPTATLDIPWPNEHWTSGRVLITRHWANQLPISIGTFYGFAQGPTWPRARQLSDQLLETFTTEMVLGMTGVRLIMGDFNQEPEQLTQHHIWMRHGWRNAQHLAEHLLHHQIVPTCKGVNERDQIWLSPEAISLLRGLRVFDHFLDHSTIALQLQVPRADCSVQKWPRPARIPWHDIDVAHWEPTQVHSWDSSQHPTEFLQKWAQGFEFSLAQHAATQGIAIPPRCQGRAARLQPTKQQLTTPTCRPSREGEVRMTNSLAGTATRLWFKQLQTDCRA